MKNITIYTDGACSGNPGKGGWACVLQHNDYSKEYSGYCPNTTNNQMELTAVIKALKSVKYPCNIQLYSDSAYVINAFNMGWIDKWIEKNWVGTKGEQVKNIELWQELLSLSKQHNITWIKVKGHADNQFNNRCDFLATQEIAKHAKED